MADEILFKLQWPVVSNAPFAQVLIYNEDRSIMHNLPAEWFDPIKDVIGVNAVKAFCYGRQVKSRLVLDANRIIDEGEWPSW